MSSDQRFEDWYQSAWKPCYRVVRAVTLHHADAEEVLSEAFTRAYEKYETLQDHPALNAWVVTTSLNVYRDRNRRLLNSKRFIMSQRETYEDVSHELSTDLLQAMSKLSTRQREIVALRILMDLSSEQTAEFLGISIPTVSTHLRRSLESLRSSLEVTSVEGANHESN
jgi:RNA polymerase sigma factor (sigma-70 family)